MHSRSISFWPFGRGNAQGSNQASISNRLEGDGTEEAPADPSAWPLPETSVEATSALELAISAYEKSCIALVQQETWLLPAWFISFFNAAHDFGLPWWAAIASVNLAARFLMVPIFIYQQKETARMASFNYDMIKVKNLQEAMTKSKTQEEQTHLHSAIKQEYSTVMAKYPNALMSFSSIPLIMVGNGLVFIGIFGATSNLMNSKAPSLRDGGALWFSDLSVPDPYFGLPIICCLVTLALVEYGISMSGDQTPAGMKPGQAQAFKLMMRAMCFLFIPMGFVWSSGSGVLVATNSAFAVLQGIALRNPSFRRKVGLPSLLEVSEMSKKVAEASAPKQVQDATALANSILEGVAKDHQGRPILLEEDPLKRKWKQISGSAPPPPGMKARR